MILVITNVITLSILIISIKDNEKQVVNYKYTNATSTSNETTVKDDKTLLQEYAYKCLDSIYTNATYIDRIRLNYKWTKRERKFYDYNEATMIWNGKTYYAYFSLWQDEQTGECSEFGNQGYKLKK